MERQVKVEVNDIVVLNQDVEVTPCIIIEEGTIGKVLDETFPYYFEVRFFENKIYWVDGKYLDVILN